MQTALSSSVSPESIETARRVQAPWFGKLFYYLFPYRRQLVFQNIRRVYGDALTQSEVVRLAQAYCAHFVRFGADFIRSPFIRPGRRKKMVRVENLDVILRAYEQRKGMLILTGHFGSWESAMVAGLQSYPQFRGVFNIVRRPLKPKFLNDYVSRRTERAGFGTIGKRGTLFTMFKVLREGKGIVFVFDQHAGGRDGVWVDFLGHPAGTFKSLAIIAMNSGAPVIPACCWREPDGTHVLRFEEPLPLVQGDDFHDSIRKNTVNFNAALGKFLLRHPDQWIWMHRRWKVKR